MPRAYKSVFFRLSFFFVLGSLAVGIIVPYDNKELAEAYSSSKPGAAASPYVVAMDLLNIPVVYCASRCLMGLALDGKAPKILAKCTRTGVPLYSVGVVLLIALLSFLQVSNGSAVVLSWIVSLVSPLRLLMCSRYLKMSGHRFFLRSCSYRLYKVHKTVAQIALCVIAVGMY